MQRGQWPRRRFSLVESVFFVVSKGEYYSPDTGLYVELADNLLKNQVFSLSPSAPFVPEIFRTPGYPAFLKLLGMESPYWVVFMVHPAYAYLS